jgi:hypothetical protein
MFSFFFGSKRLVCAVKFPLPCLELLPLFDFIQLMLHFPRKKSYDDCKSNDVDEKNNPIAELPIEHHASPSLQRRSNINVNIAVRHADASKSCTLLDQVIIKTRREDFRQRDLAIEKGNHTGAAGTGSAIGWNFNIGIFRVFYQSIACDIRGLSKEIRAL